jgi:hypothetical protein
MNQINYDAMSDTELRTYFLAHRQDQAAFHAHLDDLRSVVDYRLNRQSPTIVANTTEPDFDEKLQALIRQKLEATQTSEQDEQSLKN